MKICPKCKSKKITETLYGLVRDPDEKLQKEIDEERIELGGCCIFPDSKRFRCNDCYFEWGRP